MERREYGVGYEERVSLLPLMQGLVPLPIFFFFKFLGFEVRILMNYCRPL